MNPDMMKVASDKMSKMSPDDMERMMCMAKDMDPAMMQQAMQSMAAAASATARIAAPAAVSVASKLRASAMAVPVSAVKAVEEAEGLKASGNASFTKGEYVGATAAHRQASTLLDGLLQDGQLSGSDLQAVVDLLNGVQLNLFLSDDELLMCDNELLMRGNEILMGDNELFMSENKLSMSDDDLHRRAVRRPDVERGTPNLSPSPP